MFNLSTFLSTYLFPSVAGGFNFITAHSKGLFNSKQDATVKDVEKNCEAAFC